MIDSGELADRERSGNDRLGRLPRSGPVPGTPAADDCSGGEHERVSDWQVAERGASEIQPVVYRYPRMRNDRKDTIGKAGE
jgi:hypothetical protein